MNEFLAVGEKLLPLLNLLLLPALRTAWRVSKRLDCIEFNQRRICEKVGVDFIEVK